jgi:hypothetical protein
MSRGVIQRLIMPIIQPQLQAMKDRELPQIQDRRVEELFERELIQNFGIIGSVNRCEMLEQSTKETRQRDPVLFERYLLQVLARFAGKSSQKYARVTA